MVANIFGADSVRPQARLLFYTLTTLCLLSLGLSAKGTAAETVSHHSTEALLSLSIEELLRLEITSAAKKPQTISNTAAAIFVITQEDIRRCGATSIPEALRLAPGVNVARIDGNKWAITIRGFNGRFANKLLVLMDGRSVYTPLFSGVYWDVQDTLLEDIERIEVIRGPGATLWGANAVNGVINIITKHADKTHGLLVKGGMAARSKGLPPFATVLPSATAAAIGPMSSISTGTASTPSAGARRPMTGTPFAEASDTTAAWAPKTHLPCKAMPTAAPKGRPTKNSASPHPSSVA